MLIAFYFYENIYQFLTKPFYRVEGFHNNHFHIKGILDGFFIKFKISFLFGAFITLPIHLFHFLRFLLPALKPIEKKIVFYALLSSFCLLCLSFLYSYSYIIPVSLKFLTNRGFIPIDINIWLEYGKNIFYILQFLFFFCDYFPNSYYFAHFTQTKNSFRKHLMETKPLYYHWNCHPFGSDHSSRYY